MPCKALCAAPKVPVLESGRARTNGGVERGRLELGGCGLGLVRGKEPDLGVVCVLFALQASVVVLERCAGSFCPECRRARVRRACM